MKIVSIQERFFAGEIEKNTEKILNAIESGDDGYIYVTPELAIPGYPALDLYLDKDFQDKCFESLYKIVDKSKEQPKSLFIIGSISRQKEFKVYNVAFHIKNGEIISHTCKKLLPEYDIFWDNRYFHSGYSDTWQRNIAIHEDKRIGILICEDQWDDRYNYKPYEEIINQNADIVISLNASPYYVGKSRERIQIVKNLINRYDHKPEFFVYVNSVGGQDGYDGEQVYDGNSFIVNKIGKIRHSNGFITDIRYTNLDTLPFYNDFAFDVEQEEILQAIILGIKDYFRRCHMKKAIIGLSGGIDSAVVAALVAEAIGPENVLGVAMPSPYSSEGSITDAEQLAKNLGIDFEIIKINEIFQTIRNEMYDMSPTYQDLFDAKENQVAEENMQARARGIILMALANKIGNAMVVTTGNKTELALGYFTMYGDACGGLCPIGDLNKLQVFDLARHINKVSSKVLIPVSSIEKPPSAELAPDQTDEKGLGAGYDVLSPLVEEIIETEYDYKKLIKKYDRELVDKVLKRIYQNEYKRRQTAPCIKLTKKSFGAGRKIPMSYNPQEGHIVK